MKSAYVDILGSTGGTIYIGVTNNLERRVWEHKQHANDGFTKQYKVTKLLSMEKYSRTDDAIAREKQLKGWSREKKLALIREGNPRWNDLAWSWYGDTSSQ